MLFRPTADENLVAVQAKLDSWNADADRLRNAARSVETPTSLTVSAAEEARDELLFMLDEIDEALGRVDPCGRPFMNLLHAQTTAIALLESLSRSYDMLNRLAAINIAGPTRIVH